MDSKEGRRIFAHLILIFSLVLFTGILASCGGGGDGSSQWDKLVWDTGTWG